MPTITRGVYFIRNRPRRLIYIGSSVNIERRLQDHIRQLRAGKHPNKFLQLDWTNDGEQVFRWGVLTSVESGSIEAVEQICINEYKSYEPEHGYNQSAYSTGPLFLRLKNRRR